MSTATYPPARRTSRGPSGDPARRRIPVTGVRSLVAFAVGTVALSACSSGDSAGSGPGTSTSAMTSTSATASPSAGSGAVASVTTEPSSTQGAPVATTPAGSESVATATSDSAASEVPPAGAGTAIRIAIGDAVVEATLDDNATARDLIARLPVTVTMDDHNGVEKTGALPDELSIEGAPDGHDPVVSDIGYYAPGGDLVLYYGDAPYYDGIVRIGEFDPAAAGLVEQQPDGVTVTVTAAG